jgi:hypothetical protein
MSANQDSCTDPLGSYSSSDMSLLDRPVQLVSGLLQSCSGLLHFLLIVHYIRML